MSAQIVGDHASLMERLTDIVSRCTLEGITVEADYVEIDPGDGFRRYQSTGQLTIQIAARTMGRGSDQ